MKDRTHFNETYLEWFEKSIKAKDKFNERVFDYELFTTEALRIFTDALHGKAPVKRHLIYLYTDRNKQEINYMQLIAFLSYDGQLSWRNGGFHKITYSL